MESSSILIIVVVSIIFFVVVYKVISYLQEPAVVSVPMMGGFKKWKKK